MTLRYRCNTLSTKLLSHMDRWSIVSSSCALPLSYRDIWIVASLSFFGLIFCSEFEQDAIGVLQECYEENEATSQTLLVKELESFGHLTALDLAVMAEDQNFIAHVSCQVLLTRLWMGTMAMNTQWWKVREWYSTVVGWSWVKYENVTLWG